MLDLIVFGATGFTGAEVCAALAKDGENGLLSWGIAGRNEAKLQTVVSRCEASGAKPSAVITADLNDKESIVRMAKRARLVLNCTGPYRFFGAAVVEACVEARTHCMDLCGEPEFYDTCLLQWHEAAVDAGVLVVHAAAWDSVPADVGTLLAARTCMRRAQAAATRAGATGVAPVLTGAIGATDVAGATGVTGAAGAGGVAALVEVFHCFDGISAGHATTFRAAVHGFGAAADGTLARKRRQVRARFPDPPALAAHREWLQLQQQQLPGKKQEKKDAAVRRRNWLGWDPRVGAYALRFPGADSAVIRHSQRRLATGGQNQGSGGGGGPALCPRAAVFVGVRSLRSLALLSLCGGVFAALARFPRGRRLLLAHPRLFSLGAFTERGPTEAQLKEGRFTTTVIATPSSAAAPLGVLDGESGGGGNDGSASVVPDTPVAFPAVAITLSGPEPGYVATPQLALAMAETLLRFEGPPLDPPPPPPPGLFAPSGCCTPAALVGSGPALDFLVRRMGERGISVAGDLA